MCDHSLSCGHFLLDGWPDVTELLQKKLKEKLLGKCKPKGPHIDKTDLTVRYIHEHYHYNYHESYEEETHDCGHTRQRKAEKHEHCASQDKGHPCQHCPNQADDGSCAPLTLLEKCKLWVWDPYLWQKVCH